MTKAEFSSRANAICEKADDRQARHYKSYLAKNGEDKSQAREEDLVTAIGLPAIRIELEELGALDVPDGDEAQMDAILDSAEEAVRRTQATPSSALTEKANPFNEAEKLAKAYGLKSCGLQ